MLFLPFQDYPSIAQLVQKLSDNNIQTIFAVTEEFQPVYKVCLSESVCECTQFVAGDHSRSACVHVWERSSYLNARGMSALGRNHLLLIAVFVPHMRFLCVPSLLVMVWFIVLVCFLNRDCKAQSGWNEMVFW